MIIFISTAIGFGFGIGFLCDGFRSVTMWWLSMARKIG